MPVRASRPPQAPPPAKKSRRRLPQGLGSNSCPCLRAAVAARRRRRVIYSSWMREEKVLARSYSLLLREEKGRVIHIFYKLNQTRGTNN